MPSDNRIILAAAGSGKTTAIVSEAIGMSERSALVTFTNNAEAELRSKCYELGGFVPPNVRPMTWFTFLLRHFVRPYQRALLPGRVKGLSFVSGRSTQRVSSSNTRNYNMDGRGYIYSDKISDFACRLVEATGGAPLKRIEQIFDRIYIDEVQDMAGYDLDLIRLLLDTSINVVLVGDHRQATYKTNQSNRNRRYGGAGIVDQLESWKDAGHATIDIHNYSYRCVQRICDFADRFFPNAPPTVSKNFRETGHDGVFLVREEDVTAYTMKYSPQPLRYDRRTAVASDPVYNFGEAKGMTFNRVLIYPHGPLKKYLKSGKLCDAGKALSKVYVGVTRARQSVAFIVPNSQQQCPIPGVFLFNVQR